MYPFRHEALPYAGRDNFVPSCAAVVQGGLAHNERTIVLASQDKLDGVRDELGSQAEDVTFVATDLHGRNPSRITTMLHSFQAADDGRQALGVNERALVGRSPAAQAEAQLADMLLNAPALRSWPLSIICLYDTAELDELLLQSIYRSHAVVRGGPTPNAQFDPDLGARLYAAPLSPAPPDATRLRVRDGDLMGVRALVRRRAESFGMDAGRVDDLVLAANEVVTNSLRHGGGSADVAMWSEQDAIVCQVVDAGRIADPLVGQFAPPPSATSGRGLWLVNHVCDLVQLRSSDAGTIVRMYLDR